LTDVATPGSPGVESAAPGAAGRSDIAVPAAPGVCAAPDASGVARTLLPGGLRVLTETVPGVRSVSLGIWVGTGSRDELPAQAGAAHYLEHLLFKGTRRRGAAEIAEAFDAVGGELNAFTAKEHTCFYAHVLDDDLPMALDVLADVVTDALLNPGHVELERNVVLEELAIRDDDPEDLVGELFDAALFGEHPLGRPIVGSEESVRAMDRAVLHDFWRGRYTTPRMVVAAAGHLRHEHVVDLTAAALEAAASRAGLGAAPAPLRAAEPPTRTGIRLALLPDDSEQAHLMLGVPGLDRHDPRRPALSVLNAALGGGPSSRLFQQVREERGLAYSVYSTTATYADAGSLAVYAGCGPARLGEVATVVRGVLDDVAANGLTPAELARAQGSLRGGTVLNSEDTPSRMNRIGRSEVDHGRQRTIAESLARIDAVTGEQVAAVARELLAQPTTVAVVGPFDDESALPTSVRG
jgi:predicted Zn-dependent peptidase